MDGKREVTCRNCPFSQVVSPEDGEHPTDVLIRHGRETGHVLNINSLDDSERE